VQQSVALYHCSIDILLQLDVPLLQLKQKPLINNIAPEVYKAGLSEPTAEDLYFMEISADHLQ